MMTRYQMISELVSRSSMQDMDPQKTLALGFLLLSDQLREMTEEIRRAINREIEGTIRVPKSITLTASQILEIQKHDRIGQKMASFCNHANEVPRKCDCAEDCYCKRKGSCKSA